MREEQLQSSAAAAEEMGDVWMTAGITQGAVTMLPSLSESGEAVWDDFNPFLGDGEAPPEPPPRISRNHPGSAPQLTLPPSGERKAKSEGAVRPPRRRSVFQESLQKNMARRGEFLPPESGPGEVVRSGSARERRMRRWGGGEG